MTPAPVAPRASSRAHASGPDLGSVALSCLLLLPLSAFAQAQAEPASATPPVVVREAREVSVTATRAERNLLDVPGNVSVIDRAEIERSGAANLPELLRREAGVLVTNTTTNAEGYNVEARGFGNGGGNGCRTLVLIDGRRANEPDTGCVDWTFLTLDRVERIEVVASWPRSPAFPTRRSRSI